MNKMTLLVIIFFLPLASAQIKTILPGKIIFQYMPEYYEEVNRVQLAGSMNAWSLSDSSFDLQKQPDGSFLLEKELQEGTYFFKFIINGKWLRSMKEIEGKFKPSFAVIEEEGLGMGNAVLNVNRNREEDTLTLKRNLFEEDINLHEVSNLQANSETGKIILSLEKPENNTNEILVYSRINYFTHYNLQYELNARLTGRSTGITLQFEPLADVSVRVVTVNSERKKSRGKEIRLRVKHKNVIHDEFEGRPIFIYLPDGYAQTEKLYPVVYMHDGQNLFSTKTGSSEEWMIDETLDELISNKIIDEVIVVGVFHSSQRMEDYIPYSFNDVGASGYPFVGKGKQFADWYVNKLIPYIEGRYKVSHERENRAIMGSSLGGVISLYVANHYPDIFSMAGIISLAPTPGVLEDLKGSKKSGLKFWIDAGEKEMARDFSYVDHERIMTDILLAKGYTYGDDLIYYEVPKAIDHRESVVAERIAYPLIYFFGKKSEKIKGLNIAVEVIRSPAGTKKYIVNPIVELSNGLKHSLYNTADYKIIGSSLATIDAKGVIEFNGERKVRVQVTHKGLRQEFVIDFNKLE
jgi:predicted alpha/beta superfamily hydrolase